MQVEGCVSLGPELWAAACSSLTGASWTGSLSVFSTATTGSFFPTHWVSPSGGLTCISKLGGGAVVLGSMDGTV